METPICVIDALTLLEHIQEIKRWIQHRRLRLVVPLCSKSVPTLHAVRLCVDPVVAVENIRKLVDKQKPEPPKEDRAPRRPRVAGKPARAEHPAFDINPHVTIEFLDRIQFEQKDALRNGEVRHDALIFQQPDEEYSPWRVVEVQPVQKDFKEERPATFAQAVRHKLIITNGASGTSGPTQGKRFLVLSWPPIAYLGFTPAPTKAKLVARASATGPSPWKMHKMAPKSLPASMPKMLGPLFSYTLWRLYEKSPNPGDKNRCTLLTNDNTAHNIAHELNIPVRTISEIRQLIASAVEPVDLNSYGDLEREFRKREPKAEESINNDHVLSGGEVSPESNAEKPGEEDSLDLMKAEVCSTSNAKQPGEETVLGSMKPEVDSKSNVEKPGEATVLDSTKPEGSILSDTASQEQDSKSSISQVEQLPVVDTLKNAEAGGLETETNVSSSPRLSSETTSLSTAEAQEQEDSPQGSSSAEISGQTFELAQSTISFGKSTSPRIV